MKKTFVIILTCIITVLSFAFTACGDKTGETVLELAYRNSDCLDEKSIYFNEACERVVLNAKFEIDDGIAKMQVLDKQSNQVVWEKVASNSEKFNIELKNVAANTEYLFRIEIEDTKYIYLLITSPVKLVKNKDKPTIQ